MWLSSWHSSADYLVENPMPFYNLVVWMLSGLPTWLTGFLGFSLTISQIFHLNYIIGKHEVLYKNSYLPALLLLLFMGIIPQFLTFHPVLFANSLFIFVLDKLFKIYKNSAPLPMIFDSCFLIGIATLFYLPSITFILFLAISLFILKTFAWRDWIVGLLGLVLPFFFALIYYFWNNELDEFKTKFFPKDISQLLDAGGLMIQGYRITLTVVSVIFVLTFWKIRQNFYKNATRIRNFQQVIFMFLLVSLASLALPDRWLYIVFLFWPYR
ncbi:MAG: hypothetical protein IPP71_04195 [Bacteroidetes bacterium]|nr:hypothetical protein [Bacteroidota bacterium]